MNEPVVCGQCRVQVRYPNGQVGIGNRPMEFTGHFQVQGIPTFGFHCFGCNGRAHVQIMRDPRTGQKMRRQVQLTGNPDEYRPNKIGPQESVQIPVAYTLGDAPQAARVRSGSADHSAGRLLPDPRIGPTTLITGQHPMHPQNIRKRLHPVKLSELV